jgi:predicted site-specific integrase-resolvase
MKAKEVMKKYSITRNTLSNWVKRGYIKVEKTLSGRYIYLDSEKKESQDNEK